MCGSACLLLAEPLMDSRNLINSNQETNDLNQILDVFETQDSDQMKSVHAVIPFLLANSCNQIGLLKVIQLIAAR